MISVTPVKKNKQMLINPLNLERETHGPFEWRAINGDPQLSVAHVEVLARKWVRLQVTIKTEAPVLTPLVIYQDLGHGFSEATALYLLPDASGTIDFSWKLPSTLRALRIDPVAQVIRFSIPRFSLEPISAPEVVLRSIWTVATRYPGKLPTKAAAALRIFKTQGLKATVRRAISASNAMAQNLALQNTQPSESLAKKRQKHPERAGILEQYTNDGFARSTSKVTWQSSFVPKAPDAVKLEGLPVKLIAFYLPQFHPFAENDAWWGKGFTEWTNVSKAQPQYLGHHQPRLPGELGFYDLRLPEVMRQQIDLAHHYGVTGFCFHHYWFGGKRLMERPVNQLLADPTLDIDFCLCWANENWTRRWDGADADVLIAQQHSAEDDLAFFADILPALKDPRYIKVDGKPLLIVYRATLLPDAAATLSRWRAAAITAGLKGLYLVAAKSHDMTDPRPYGFDAAVEFPPHQIDVKEITHQKTIVNPNFSGKIYDYPDLAKRQGSVKDDHFLCFKTIMPSWDNEARKPGAGYVFDDAKPEFYAHWLASAIETTLQHPENKRLVFVNAWNEWAEGACLEPDRHFGYAYLHATANVLRNFPNAEVASAIAQVNVDFKRSHSSAIVLHLYYEDLIPALFDGYLTALQGECDLFVTVRPDIKLDSLQKIKGLFPNVFFVHSENRGRDIRPFVKALCEVQKLGYTYICKLHTKKSLHRQDGAQWRDTLFGSLIGSPQRVRDISDRFKENPQLGIYAPTGSLTDLSEIPINLGNRKWLDILFHRLKTENLIGKYTVEFPAGSMYWAKVDALLQLTQIEIIDANEFELEAGQLDGTLAHAIERIIGLLAQINGFHICAHESDLIHNSR